MELRDMILVLKKQKHLFGGIVLLFVIGALIWQGMQPPRYQATLLINIGRSGVQETNEYTFDSFYRLQADERFADTVVRWLASPRVVEDIYHEASLNTENLASTKALSGFSAKRLSSQMISVTYTGSNEKVLKELAASVVTVLNRYTETLNTDGKEQAWFVVIGSDPVLGDARVSREIALLVGVGAGVFVAFWLVLFRHYFSREIR
jgi:uncharacterized protein involved in exopolysaccharide biosynthesis